MNKAIRYAVNGSLACAILNSLLNAFNQMNEIEKSPSQEFDWKRLLKSAGKGALLGGTAGFLVGVIKDDDMAERLAAIGGTSGYIKSALENYSDDDEMLLKKAEYLQNLIYQKFKDSLSEYPRLAGSFIKGTAINGSDIDIQVKFNKNAYKIKDINEVIESFLLKNYSDKNLIRIRNQNYSLGILFNLKGNDRRIDIVPMREIENGQGDTFIYSSNDYSIKKTNTRKQLQALKLTEKEKKIIQLLKGWKLINGIELSSTFIDYIVKRAFQERKMPRGLDKSLLEVIGYIGSKITSIRVVDPANSNNIISESLTSDEKQAISVFCITMLYEIEKDSRNIMDYFDI